MGSNPGLQHRRRILHHLSHQGDLDHFSRDRIICESMAARKKSAGRARPPTPTPPQVWAAAGPLLVFLLSGCESHFADPLYKLYGGCLEVRELSKAFSAGTDSTDPCVTFAGTLGTSQAAAGPAGTSPAAHSACAPGRAGPAITASPGGCETFFSFQPSGRSRVLAGGGRGTGVLLHFEDGEKRPEFSEPVFGARCLQSPRRPVRNAGEASPGEGAPAGRR